MSYTDADERARMYAEEDRAFDIQRQRRYALFQAAIYIYVEFCREGVDDWSKEQAVTEAESILAEIEKRESK